MIKSKLNPLTNDSATISSCLRHRRDVTIGCQHVRVGRLGRVTKMGNAYLRKLLVVDAHAVLYHRTRHIDPLHCWAQKLMETKPFKLVAVAIANKLARIAFAVMTTGQSYHAANV